MINLDNVKFSINFPVPSEIWEGWITNNKILRGKAIALTRGNIDEAEDLLSCTITKAVNHIHKYGTIIHTPRAFFLIALKNEFINRNRRLNFERRLRNFEVDIHQDDLINAGESTPDQEESLNQQELLTAILRVVKTLGPTYQDLFRMRFCEERSYQEIADSLNISSALARKRIQLLRRKLLGAAPRADISALHRSRSQTLRLSVSANDRS